LKRMTMALAHGDAARVAAFPSTQVRIEP